MIDSMKKVISSIVKIRNLDKAHIAPDIKHSLVFGPLLSDIRSELCSLHIDANLSVQDSSYEAEIRELLAVRLEPIERNLREALRAMGVAD